MLNPEVRIGELEKEVQRLKIKLEILVNHLQVEQAPGFTAPGGRDRYDRMVATELTKQKL
jgi:hypothetical protein